MAIEIIPKPKVKKKIKLSPANFGYYAAVLLLVVAVLAYFTLYFLEGRMKAKAEELDTLIGEKQEPANQALEKRIFVFKRKLETFSQVLSSRRKPSQFFSFFKPLCHPRAFFPDLELKAEEQRAELSGQTESFKTLREQISIFTREERIKEMELQGASVAKEGGVSFDLVLPLDVEVFK